MENWTIFGDQLLVEALGWSVVHSLWQGALLVLLIKGIFHLWPNTSARRRYGLAYSALMIQLGLAFGTFLLRYDIGQATTVESELANSMIAAVPELSNAPATTVPFLLQLQQFIEPSLPMIAMVWWLGMVFFLLKMLLGYYWWAQLRYRLHQPAPAAWEQLVSDLCTKMNIRQNVRLQLSDEVFGPLLLGQVKPLILFPLALLNQLTIKEVEAVLVHELAHLQRYDYLLNILQLFVEAVFYYHPAVWWLGHEIRTLREQACDDVAVYHTGNSLAYAKTLLRVADHQREPRAQFALGLLGQNKQLLLQRVKRILNQPDKQSEMREKFAVMSVVLSLALLASISAGWSWPVVEDLGAASTEVENALLDTLPQGKIHLEIDKEGEKMDVTIEDGAIQKLHINGEEIPQTQFPAYEAMVKEKLATVPAPPGPPTPPAPPGAPVPPAPPAPPGAPAPSKVIIKNKTETIHIGDDGEEEIIIYESEGGTDGSHIWIEEDGDNEHIFMIIPDGDGKNKIKMRTSDGEETIFIMKGEEGVDILEDLDIDLDEIENIDVLKLSGDGMIDEERLNEIIMEAEERAIQIERIVEERHAEVEERRAQIERERSRIERQAYERHLEGLRFSGHDNENWLGEQLLADGLVDKADNFTFKLTDKRLKVNGKNQSDEMHQRYMDYYQRRNGITFGGGTVISVNQKSK